MSFRGCPQPSCCLKAKQHDNQPIQYICLQQSCLLNRLLCKTCVHESHRRHKVGIIDKLIEPLSRLNMNSCYQTSLQDHKYLQQRYDAVLDQWNKMCQMLERYTVELQAGILFQLNILMKTFTNDQIDRAYQLLLDNKTEPQTVNEYVKMINFLSKDYLQDVEEVKKYADFVSEKAKRAINKTVKKMDTIMKKMNDFFKILNFNKFQQFKIDPQAQDHSQNKQEKALDEPLNKQEDDPKTATQQATLKLKQPDVPEEQSTRPYRPTHTPPSIPRKLSSQRYK